MTTAVLVNEQIGIPFEDLNCLQLASRVLEQHGHEPLDPEGDLARAHAAGPVAGDRVLPRRFHWDPVPAGQEQRLDVVMILDHGVASHLGVVGEDGWVLTTRIGGRSHLVQLRRLRRAGLIHSVWRPAC